MKNQDAISKLCFFKKFEKFSQYIRKIEIVMDKLNKVIATTKTSRLKQNLDGFRKFTDTAIF